MRKAWELAFKNTSAEFQSFSTVTEALQHNLDKSSIIYIDFDLGNGLNGLKESKKLFEAGFLEIYLATGHDQMELPPHIRGQVGKRPPKE